MNATFSTLEELALRRGVTVRTAQRWLTAGRVERVVLDDGAPAYRLSDTVSDNAENREEHRAECEKAVSDNDNVGHAVSRDSDESAPCTDPVRPRPVDRPGTTTAAAARITRQVRDLVGMAYLATCDCAEAVHALAAYAKEQAMYESAFMNIESSPGQPGDEAWTMISEAITTCATELQGLLDRREVDDPTLARVNLALRDVERQWRRAREWEAAHFPDDDYIEPFQLRIAREMADLGRTFEALRRALIE